MTSQTTHPDYPYSNDTIEPKRLAILSALYDAQSIDWLSAYLKPGQHVLELGCGEGQLAKKMLPLLQPEGAYTGIELNKKRAADAAAALANFKNITIINQDALEAIQSLPKKQFDVIYFRWFLWIIPQHQRVDFLKNLFSLLKPGGVILAEEADMTTQKTEPALPCMQAYKDALTLRNKHNNQPLTLGLDIKTLLKEANDACQISDPLYFQPTTNEAALKLLPYYGICSTKDALLEAGITEEQYHELTNQLKAMAEDKDTTLYSTTNTFTAAR